MGQILSNLRNVAIVCRTRSYDRSTMLLTWFREKISTSRRRSLKSRKDEEKEVKSTFSTPQVEIENSADTTTNDVVHNEVSLPTQVLTISKDEEMRCSICLDDLTVPKSLDQCGHTFCTECIDEYFRRVKPQCPCCFVIYGEIRGNQPDDGEMFIRLTRHLLPGFEETSTGTIEIYYQFPDGIQDERHPHPGVPYKGTIRKAFLPNSSEGRHVLKLLSKAFELRQTFTVGESRTTGSKNVVTWNDIHHKTWYAGGPENFGYPDDTYLNRVQQELAAKGIK